MNNDISKKLNSILSSMSPQEIQKLMQLTKNNNIASKLTPAQKERLINEFSKLDNNEIKQKLSKFKPSDVAGLSADELVEKIRKL